MGAPKCAQAYLRCDSASVCRNTVEELRELLCIGYRYAYEGWIPRPRLFDHPRVSPLFHRLRRQETSMSGKPGTRNLPMYVDAFWREIWHDSSWRRTNDSVGALRKHSTAPTTICSAYPLGRFRCHTPRLEFEKARRLRHQTIAGFICAETGPGLLKLQAWSRILRENVTYTQPCGQRANTSSRQNPLQPNPGVPNHTPRTSAT